ncbi:hypothetical protein KR093_007456 [Drosophila rubida]|uniref:Gustatory receptor n=1 Tax=Drosophila rubida TaxID=30044 RepID=A0AAD4KE97_9MUSC|nr:hypothetical protein KR093_007456 [Drosophila rubida]
MQPIVTHSKLTYLCIKIYPVIMELLIVSSLYSVHRWQHKILKLLMDLLNMESIEFEPYFYKKNAQQQSLFKLLKLRIVLILPSTFILIVLIYLGNISSIYFANICLGRTVVTSVAFLLFVVIWQIWQFSLKMQISLEYLLHHPRPMPMQLQKILHIQRIFYRLIDTINELNIIFKYPIFLCIIHVVNHTCFTSYMLIRVIFGEPLIKFTSKTYICVALLNVMELFEVYSLAKLSSLANKHIETILNILRYPTLNRDSVDRCNEWFSLQLCAQNINISVFGICTIDLKLVFSIIANIILLVIYMVQSDYIFMSTV